MYSLKIKKWLNFTDIIITFKICLLNMCQKIIRKYINSYHFFLTSMHYCDDILCEWGILVIQMITEKCMIQSYSSFYLKWVCKIGTFKIKDQLEFIYMICNRQGTSRNFSFDKNVVDTEVWVPTSFSFNSIVEYSYD